MRRDMPVWFAGGFFGALVLSPGGELAQLGGFLAGAWWGFLKAGEWETRL